MSDTPETDNMASMQRTSHEWIDFARKLERDRDEQKRLVDKLKVQLTKALEAAANRTS